MMPSGKRPDWVGMAPCMGPMSPIRAYSLWAGLCPEKAKTKTKQKSSSNGCKRGKEPACQVSQRWEECFEIKTQWLVVESSLNTHEVTPGCRIPVQISNSKFSGIHIFHQPTSYSLFWLEMLFFFQVFVKRQKRASTNTNLNKGE